MRSRRTARSSRSASRRRTLPRCASPRLDAAADPHLLLRPELVELAPTHRLGRELGGLLTLVGGVIARIAARSHDPAQGCVSPPWTSPKRARGASAASSALSDPRSMVLDQVVTRILELDRGWLRSYPGNYSGLRASEAAGSRPRRWSAQVRQGSGPGGRCGSARRRGARTRNRGQGAPLEALRDERAVRRERIGTYGSRSTRASVRESSWRNSRRCRSATTSGCVANLDLRLMRGDRLALAGPQWGRQVHAQSG